MSPTPFPIESSSPLREVPEDYCPAEAARWLRLKRGPNAGKRLFHCDYTIGGTSAATPIAR
jgi:hypothetical protein